MTGNMVEAQGPLKVFLLGASESGKTALLTRFASDQFSTDYHATIGCDFCAKTVQIENGQIALQIWDTSGQERFQALLSMYYRGSTCCVLVFDITSAASFAQVDSLRQGLLTRGSSANEALFPFVLVGSKADGEAERQVTWNEAMTYARCHNMPYFEASAREGRNVQAIFEETARLALAFSKL